MRAKIPLKRTKIVATLGPASDSLEVIENLILAGVNVFRLNFSHGSHAYHKSTLQKIRQAQKNLQVRVGVLQDICGPKIRVGTLEKAFDLKKGDTLKFRDKPITGMQTQVGHYEISINQQGILPMLKNGDSIYLCDGMISVKVVDTTEGITTIVQNDGILSSNKGVNFPNTKLGINVITPKDKEDMEWGAQNGVDFVAISFVQNKNDILQAREILKSLGSSAKIFAKIEKFEAIEHIDEIIENSDGIMVARGDLGIEAPYYKVPPIQKMIITKSNVANKPVITATQMMFSMAKSSHATRAEISDVANAVLDGSDAVMLSEESAVGVNPVAVVEAMSATILESEKFYRFKDFDFAIDDETSKIARSTVQLARDIDAKKIITITGSGQSALKMSRNRPNMTILAICHSEDVARSLTIAWGVHPFLVVQKDKLEKILSDVVSALVSQKVIELDGTYIVTSGHPIGVPGSTNFIRILRKDQIEYYLSLKGE